MRLGKFKGDTGVKQSNQGKGMHRVKRMRGEKVTAPGGLSDTVLTSPTPGSPLQAEIYHDVVYIMKLYMKYIMMFQVGLLGEKMRAAKWRPPFSLTSFHP